MGDERERDDAHRLLRIAGAVGEGDEGRRADLPPAEPGLSTALGDALGDRVHEEGADRGDHPGDDGRQEGGNDEGSRLLYFPNTL